MKTRIPPVLITFALVCFALVQNTQAVIPPPDGAYPNFTTAEGQKALFNLTTGSANTAVGWFSLWGNAEGSFNTATGAAALLFNTADANTAFGTAALLFNSTGFNNTAIGAAALLNNDTGFENTANGAFALHDNTGSDNTATGAFALSSNTTGIENTANGASALFNNTIGSFNTATGVAALSSNTEGTFNTATGDVALQFNTTGDNNTANGYHALLSNTIGGDNTAIGFGALASITTDNSNTAIGSHTLSNITGGSANLALGNDAGSNLVNGNGNIYIKNPGTTSEDVTIRIGAGQTRTFIAGIRGVATGVNDAVNVMIDSAGQLGTMSSSRRFKKEIRPMDKASESVLALKPVTFHYKSDTKETPQFGLIAEEVAGINPDLVVRDENGEIYTVRYEAVNAMLLNEFLKEHRKVQKLETNDAEQQREIKALVATVKEQAAQIQKVSAQLAAASPSRGGLELNRLAPQTVLNNR